MALWSNGCTDNPQIHRHRHADSHTRTDAGRRQVRNENTDLCVCVNVGVVDEPDTRLDFAKKVSSPCLACQLLRNLTGWGSAFDFLGGLTRITCQNTCCKPSTCCSQILGTYRRLALSSSIYHQITIRSVDLFSQLSTGGPI